MRTVGAAMWFGRKFDHGDELIRAVPSLFKQFAVGCSHRSLVGINHPSWKLATDATKAVTILLNQNYLTIRCQWQC